MACISIKNKTISRSMLVGNTPFDPAATWLIQRVAGTGSNTTITFDSIASTYQHLQLRFMVKSTTTAFPMTQMQIRFNSDTGSNYSYHRLLADGGAVSAFGAASQSAVVLDGVAVTSQSPISASTFSAAIVDILDYKSTTKNKTVRAFSGADRNGAATSDPAIALNSSVWMNTNAITRIDVLINGGNYATNSTIALYGIKGA